jgi:hypothetical protein
MRDWRTVGQSFALLVAIPLRLRLTRFTRVVAWATRTVPRSPGLAADVERTAFCVRLAAHVVPTRCLTRALALARLLGRRGIVTDLRIGVRTEDGRLEAHAWVESMGRVLNDDHRRLQGYVAFDRILGENTDG